MKRLWIRNLYFFLTALLFTACGDTIYITNIYGDSNASTQTTKTSGTVIDDYVKDADVCVDVNNNGQLEKTIDLPCVKSNATGKFIFESNVSASSLIMSRGTDIATNKPFTGSYTAPAGSRVITPLTSIVQALVKLGKSLDEAHELVKVSFNLPNVDLMSYDPIANLTSTTTNEIANAKKVFAEQSSIQVILTTVSTTVAASSLGTNAEDVTAQTAKQIATLLIQNSSDSSTSIDIANTSNLTAILNTTSMAELNTTLDARLVTAITEQMNAISIQIVAAIDNNNTASTIGDIRQATAQVATVNQNNTESIATAIIAITEGNSTETIDDLITSISTDTNTLVTDIAAAVTSVTPATQLGSVASTLENNTSTNPVNSLKGIALYGANLTQVNGNRRYNMAQFDSITAELTALYFDFDQKAFTQSPTKQEIFVNAQQNSLSNISYSINTAGQLVASLNQDEIYSLTLKSEKNLTSSRLEAYRSDITLKGKAYSVETKYLSNFYIIDKLVSSDTFDNLNEFIQKYQNKVFMGDYFKGLVFTKDNKLQEREDGKLTDAGSYEIKTINDLEILLIYPDNVNYYYAEDGCYVLNFSRVWKAKCYLKGSTKKSTYYDKEVYDDVELYLQEKFINVNFSI